MAETEDPLDYEGALSQCCDDVPFLKEMLGELHVEVQDKLKNMQTKLADPMVVKFNAHSIKGVCKNFICLPMANLAQRLEFVAKPFIMDLSRQDRESPDYLSAKKIKTKEFATKQGEVTKLFAALEKEFIRYEKYVIEDPRICIEIKTKYEGLGGSKVELTKKVVGPPSSS